MRASTSRFTHLLLTGFNMRISGCPGLDPAWLSHRFELFDRFCYPSVRAQSNQNFKWLVFCDVDTPREFKDRLEAHAEWKGFLPYYTRTLEAYREPVLENIDGSATHLITTNLDNDDAVAETFIENVQQQFDGQEFQLVNFPTGLRLRLRRPKLYAHQVQANPFLSLIERNDDVTTIRGCGPHNLLESKYDDIRDVESEPLWLQVVHGRNIAATGIWGCRRVPLSVLDRGFSLRYQHGVGREGRLAIGLENRWRGIERVLIESVGPRMIQAIRSGLKWKRRSLAKRE